MIAWLSTLTPDGQLKAIALFGAAVAFVVGLLQYRKSQRWKRSEWVAQEMDGFFKDPVVRSALCMIDWGARRLELYPNREKPEERFVVVTDDRMARALEFHENRPEGFTEDEAAIRDAFDHLLDRLERIHSFVEAGLVTVADVSPYLRYWAEHILAARTDDPKVQRLVQLRRFIDRYSFSGVAILFDRLAGRR